MGKKCRLLFVLIVAMVILGVCIGIPLASKKAKEEKNHDVAITIDSLCQSTSYPATCNQTLAGSNYTADSVIRLSLQSATKGVDQTRDQVLSSTATNAQAVNICSEALASAQEYVDAALTELDQGFHSSKAMNNIKAWVSAAMEFHTTCVDAVTGLQANHTDQLFSNALAFVNAAAQYGDDVTSWKNTAFSFLGDLHNVHIPPIPGLSNRKLLSIDWGTESDVLPAWVDGQTQRRLLQTSTNYDVKVAQDGTGDYTTIQAAVNFHEVNTARLVIYVAAGTYNEQVNVPKTCKFLTIVGDGDATIITGNWNVALMPGMTTYRSATLIVSGEGFIGKSFRVQNTAGAAGHQAVAFRGSADRIAFYKVTFDGYQDTLYAHAGRQFYRECTIGGTVDFIFGNAAAAFQSCSVVAKRTTLMGQQNTISAQGRTDPHQSTGLTFQNCTFDGTPELKANTTLYKTYLGRPWKANSVCVIMKSQITEVIDPTGWLPWNTSSFGLSTSYFAEYQNSGAGASPVTRVHWSHQIEPSQLELDSVANNFIASNFVQAGDWLPGHDVPFTTTL